MSASPGLGHDRERRDRVSGDGGNAAADAAKEGRPLLPLPLAALAGGSCGLSWNGLGWRARRRARRRVGASASSPASSSTPFCRMPPPLLLLGAGWRKRHRSP